MVVVVRMVVVVPEVKADRRHAVDFVVLHVGALL